MRKLLAVLMLFGAAAGVARAEETAATPEALARVFACQSITDPGERVTCYDAAVGQLHAAETQGQIVAVDRAQAQDIARDSFGFQLPSLSRLIPRLGGGSDENMDAVQLVVERVISRADGTHAFVMNNGQIWAQIERQEARNVQPGDEVTIRRAALGSFRLVSSRGGAGHRVRREN